MVVPVFMTNCQVSLNLKIGPEIAHTIITETARMNVAGLPVILAVIVENLVKNEDFCLANFLLLKCAAALLLPV
jgi:hypothetical protein